jgi:hypothetical protein
MRRRRPVDVDRVQYSEFVLIEAVDEHGKPASGVTISPRTTGAMWRRSIEEIARRSWAGLGWIDAPRLSCGDPTGSSEVKERLTMNWPATSATPGEGTTWSVSGVHRISGLTVVIRDRAGA